MRKLLIVTAVLVCLGALSGRAQDPAEPKAGPDPTERNLDVYQIRVDDTVEVIVYEEPQLSRQYLVPGNGHVSMPGLGKIQLLDRTPFEVEEVVSMKLKEEGIKTDVNVACIVTGYAPRTAYLVGAVHRSINLPVHREVRLLEFLAMSDALGSDRIDYAHITVRRTDENGTPFNFQVNLDDILERNQEEKNLVIFEGDLVRTRGLQGTDIQSSEFVYVLGKVGAPGRHPIIRGPTPFTLTKLIALVGDFLEFADRAKVKIIRQTPTGRQAFTVDFDDVIEGLVPDVELQPDDLIYVPESWI
jgi:polysaccharide export outer membrane protein